MKTITERNTEIITDLIKINNDRVAGYTKAAKEISETDDELKLLFEDMAAQSTQFASELRKWIDSTDYEPLNSTTISGGIYRVWMDVKATFTGDDRMTDEGAAERVAGDLKDAAGQVGQAAGQTIHDLNQ